MKTIAQQINWDFEENGSLVILNKNGKQIYWERSNGQWAKLKWDFNGNQIYYENSTGLWTKRKYDSKGKEFYFVNSDGFWAKKAYDSEGNEIYYEDSDGKIIDNRPKPSEDKVVEIEGVKYKLTKL